MRQQILCISVHGHYDIVLFENLSIASAQSVHTCVCLKIDDVRIGALVPHNPTLLD